MRESGGNGMLGKDVRGHVVRVGDRIIVALHVGIATAAAVRCRWRLRDDQLIALDAAAQIVDRLLQLDVAHILRPAGCVHTCRLKRAVGRKRVGMQPAV